MLTSNCIIFFSYPFYNTQIDEIPQDIVKKTIRIRGGKINHWNGKKKTLLTNEQK